MAEGTLTKVRTKHLQHAWVKADLDGYHLEHPKLTPLIFSLNKKIKRKYNLRECCCTRPNVSSNNVCKSKKRLSKVEWKAGRHNLITTPSPCLPDLSGDSSQFLTSPHLVISCVKMDRCEKMWCIFSPPVPTSKRYWGSGFQTPLGPFYTSNKLLVGSSNSIPWTPLRGDSLRACATNPI